MLHQIIEDNLESCLSGGGSPETQAAVRHHLDTCAGCRQVVSAMQTQARWIRALRPPAGVAPAPGFYARVMDRIEAGSGSSFWSFFLDPQSGRRLAYASLALLAVLVGVAVSTETANATASIGPMEIIAEHEYPPAPGIDQQRDRDVVLVNLATWSPGGPGVVAQPAFLQSDSQ